MQKTALFVFILLATTPHFGQQSTRRSDKPNVFFEDTQIAPPASIPENVVSLLLQTDVGKQGADFTAGLVANGRCEAQACNPANLFRAATVHLDGSNEKDLVAIGVCPMCGVWAGSGSFGQRTTTQRSFFLPPALPLSFSNRGQEDCATCAVNGWELPKRVRRSITLTAPTTNSGKKQVLRTRPKPASLALHPRFTSDPLPGRRLR